MLLRHVVALSIFTLSTTVFADALDVNLRDNSAQFQYSAAMGTATLGKTEMHAGYLYTGKVNNYFADFGIVVKDAVSPEVQGLIVGFGMKGILAKAAANKTSAIALGGLVRYAPPAAPRIGLVASAYWSPNILTFGDADRSIETGLRVEYEVIPQATAYLGYRKIRFGIKNAADETLDEGAHLGVRLSF
ncbi:MAG: hypothetical protein HOO95_02635 [Gallionella sp.]|nr:hypothetical protein [Gallionella sp.]